MQLGQASPLEAASGPHPDVKNAIRQELIPISVIVSAQPVDIDPVAPRVVRQAVQANRERVSVLTIGRQHLYKNGSIIVPSSLADSLV